MIRCEISDHFLSHYALESVQESLAHLRHPELTCLLSKHVQELESPQKHCLLKLRLL